MFGRSKELEIRHPSQRDVEATLAFIQLVLDENPGDPTVADAQRMLGVVDWPHEWIAGFGKTVVGAIVKRTDAIDGIWVLAERRSQGIGSMLLATAEQDMAKRGHAIGSTKIVEANARAITFFQRNGYREHARHVHSRTPATLIELRKELSL
jgi:GNAT superfamily N-acetyltransferase